MYITTSKQYFPKLSCVTNKGKPQIHFDDIAIKSTEAQRRQHKITFVFCILCFIFCIFVFYILYFCVLYFVFLCFIFCILYFVFYILYFIFCILYFVFYILYFIFCILYFCVIIMFLDVGLYRHLVIQIVIFNNNVKT